MSGLSMHRLYLPLIVAATGLSGAFQTALEAQARNVEMQRFSTAGVVSVDRTTSPAPRPSSNLAKLRDLSFLRGRRGPRRTSGVPMSCAEGKRRARKARNRARHKAHVTKARRRA